MLFSGQLNSHLCLFSLHHSLFSVRHSRVAQELEGGEAQHESIEAGTATEPVSNTHIIITVTDSP